MLLSFVDIDRMRLPCKLLNSPVLDRSLLQLQLVVDDPVRDVLLDFVLEDLLVDRNPIDIRTLGVGFARVRTAPVLSHIYVSLSF